MYKSNTLQKWTFSSCTVVFNCTSSHSLHFFSFIIFFFCLVSNVTLYKITIISRNESASALYWKVIVLGITCWVLKAQHAFLTFLYMTYKNTKEYLAVVRLKCQASFSLNMLFQNDQACNSFFPEAGKED